MRMYLFPTETLKVILFLYILTTIFSCSKDSDLLADYVGKDGLEVADFGSFVMDDHYITSRDKSIVLNVLSNDAFADLEKVKIVETSTAKNGRIVINEDNTLTYTPSGNAIPKGPKNQTPTTETETTETTETQTTETQTTETITPEAEDAEPSGTETPTTETPEPQEPEPEATSTDDTADNTSSGEEVTDTSSGEEVTDTFTYTTEEENEDGTITTEEGTVTVTITDTDTNETEESDTDDIAEQSEPDTTTNTAIFPDAYYVTSSGNSSNDGKSEANAWSLTHAISMVKAGDVVYVKSGNYSLGMLNIKNSGTASSPIKFIGYTKVPGDIVSEAYSTFDYGDTPATSGMPIFDGSYTENRVLISGDYVECYNILVKGAKRGFQMKGDNFIIDNCVAWEIGKANDETYAGDGFITWNGENGTVRNCHAERIQMYGFWAYVGNNNLWENNESYYVQNWETDYMFAIWAANNTVDGLKAYRMYNGRHTSRVFDIKHGRNNFAKNIYGYNSRLEFHDAHDNVVESVVIEGTNNTNTNFQEGSSGNIIANSYIQCNSSAVGFTQSGGSGNNKFINNIFWKDPETASHVNYPMIRFIGDNGKNSLFLNCIFKGFQGEVAKIEGSGTTGVKFINCNFVDNPKTTTIINYQGHSFSNFEFANNNVYNTGFSWPSDSKFSGNISANPEFKTTGAGAERFELGPASPLIDRGISHPDRITDYNGDTLLGLPDIGAYEH